MIKYPDKNEVLKKFKEKYVDNVWVESFIKSDEFYRDNKDKIDANLQNTFDSLCNYCVKMQKQNLKGSISYIYFSILRTSIRESKGEFRIDFYDKNWFLDNNECSININLDFLYKELFELENSLKEKKTEFGRTINDLDVEEIILDEADKYNVLCAEFLKDIILNKFIKSSYFKEMNKNEDLKILIGEFMGEAEMIFDNEKSISENQ